jgi:DNA-binding CsgD family transcriptional regulator
MEFQRHAFLILSLEEKVSIGPSETQRTELARFGLYGKIFIVVEDDVGVRSERYSDTSGLVEQLTKRELQIAIRVAAGEPTKRIAFQLGISEWTVATHLRRIFAKLRVDTRAAMVYRCASLIRRLDSDRPQGADDSVAGDRVGPNCGRAPFYSRTGALSR